MHSIVAQIQEYLVIDDDLMHTIVVWAEIPILVATEGELSGREKRQSTSFGLNSCRPLVGLGLKDESLSSLRV
jgi:hypothetical protein